MGKKHWLDEIVCYAVQKSSVRKTKKPALVMYWLSVILIRRSMQPSLQENMQRPCLSVSS